MTAIYTYLKIYALLIANCNSKSFAKSPPTKVMLKFPFRLARISSHILSPSQKRLKMTSVHCNAQPSTSKEAAAQPPSIASLLTGFEKILNIRDLAEASSKIKPGRIYRSGSPAHASIDDVKLLRSQLRIQSLIDLRSSTERKEDSAWSLMCSNGTIKTYDIEGNLTEVACDHNADLAGVDIPECELHRLSLLERDRFVRGLLWKLPFSKLAPAMVYKLLGYEEKMRDIVVPEINRGGLQLVYEITMETAGADICRTLELITDAAESRRSQMFFCKLGKDRTGLIAALVLSCCDISEEEIVTDYTKSDGVDEIALGGLEKMHMKDVQGMDKAIFSSAPPEAMKALFEVSITCVVLCLSELFLTLMFIHNCSILGQSLVVCINIWRALGSLLKTNRG